MAGKKPVRMRWDISGYRDLRNWPTHGGVKVLPATEAAEIVAMGAADYVSRGASRKIDQEIREAEAQEGP